MKYQVLPRFFTKRYKYRVIELDNDRHIFNTGIKGYSVDTPFIRLTTKGKLYPKVGYAWNGANCCPDTNKMKRPSLGHDMLCQLVSEGYLPYKMRKVADNLIAQWYIEEGGSEFVANKIILTGVRIGTALHRKKQKKELKVYNL